MRLIDYDAAIDRYYAEYEKQDICDGSQDRDFLKRCFDEAPTVDVAPVVHGTWETHLLPLAWKCSVCGFKNSFRAGRTIEYLNYCPRCGAKMDLPEDSD